MSLSKYYKNSNSFQPEKLVKEKDNQATGWQSTQHSRPEPFQQQKISSEQPPLARAGKLPTIEQTVPQNTDQTPSLDQDIDSTQNHTQEEPEKTEPQIDLSQYIEVAEAEEKIREAYNQGMRDAEEKADLDYLTATRSLIGLCQQLDTIRDTIINNSTQELQDFALSIAERILRISVQEQDKTIIATIQEALHKAVKSDEFLIFIHPDDLDTVAARSESIIDEISGLTNLVIKRDSTVERGGVRIESDNCVIDATISSQFETIRQAILANNS